MSILTEILSEKKAERRRHMAAAEVLAKQINDLEKKIKESVTKPVTKTTTKPVTKSTTKKPARKGVKSK